ncbi:MAG: sugar phosphate nucleotidyltransferase [Eubacteriales bacterium]|nr:sugar phosphate nucleotidyltransferase [Eubacteriales bacterium]
MDKTLVIMAAGMGSRYGGDKQIDGMGPHNEVLMLYSIYDAVKAGFTKVVFIIKHSFEARFKESVGDVVKGKVKVEYAFQELSDLPAGCSIPAERTKPLGTVQALLSAKDLIHEPFAVINADDYYGVPAYKTMIEHLGKLNPEKHACMVGYYLKNTVSENGHVTRGVCTVDAENHLSSVTETYKIQPFPDGTIRDTEKDPNGVILDPECLVSMNFFGFTPWLFEKAEARLTSFLKGLSPTELKAEYVLPVLVDQLMHEEGLKVDMLTTDAVWFGVTYKEDKPYVQQELLKMHRNGTYPDALF